MKNVIKNTAPGTKVLVTTFSGETFTGTIAEVNEHVAAMARCNALLTGKAIKVTYDFNPGRYACFSPKTGKAYGDTYQRSTISEL